MGCMKSREGGRKQNSLAWSRTSSLSYIMNLRPAWVTCEHVCIIKKKRRGGGRKGGGEKARYQATLINYSIFLLLY